MPQALSYSPASDRPVRHADCGSFMMRVNVFEPVFFTQLHNDVLVGITHDRENVIAASASGNASFPAASLKSIPNHTGQMTTPTTPAATVYA